MKRDGEKCDEGTGSTLTFVGPPYWNDASFWNCNYSDRHSGVQDGVGKSCLHLVEMKSKGNGITLGRHKRSSLSCYTAPYSAPINTQIQTLHWHLNVHGFQVHTQVRRKAGTRVYSYETLTIQTRNILSHNYLTLVMTTKKKKKTVLLRNSGRRWRGTWKGEMDTWGARAVWRHATAAAAQVWCSRSAWPPAAAGPWWTSRHTSAAADSTIKQRSANSFLSFLRNNVGTRKIIAINMCEDLLWDHGVYR